LCHENAPRAAEKDIDERGEGENRKIRRWRKGMKRRKGKRRNRRNVRRKEKENEEIGGR
jgi:hypothetical protein